MTREKAEISADWDLEVEKESDNIPIHKHWHPYVVTRTQLRIVDETALFNLEAYNKAHKELMACGPGHPNIKTRLNKCNRHYVKNGHWETRLELETPVPGNSSDLQTEWAYGLYHSFMNQVFHCNYFSRPLPQCFASRGRTPGRIYLSCESLVMMLISSSLG
jgi:hypothetical protein